MATSNTGAPRTVAMTPLNMAPGHYGHAGTVVFGLSGDATYNQAGSGSGGWQVVERPKRVAATQWFDRAPWQLSFDGVINNEITLGQNNIFSNQISNALIASENNQVPTVINTPDFVSIENVCASLESWLDAIPNTLEPPAFSIVGPVPGIQHLWCIYNMEFGEALRHPTEGWRYQQNVKFVLYEYTPPFGEKSINQTNGHVSTFNYNTNTGDYSFNRYTVVNGDTVQKIANKFRVSKATIMQLNNIRDPRNGITPGQTLIIPNS